MGDNGENPAAVLHFIRHYLSEMTPPSVGGTGCICSPKQRFGVQLGAGFRSAVNPLRLNSVCYAGVLSFLENNTAETVSIKDIDSKKHMKASVVTASLEDNDILNSRCLAGGCTVLCEVQF